jgi:hypothetical protein
MPELYPQLYVQFKLTLLQGFKLYGNALFKRFNSMPLFRLMRNGKALKQNKPEDLPEWNLKIIAFGIKATWLCFKQNLCCCEPSPGQGSLPKRKIWFTKNTLTEQGLIVKPFNR